MAANCILIAGDPVYGEATATATVTPGMLVDRAGGLRTISSNPTCAPAAAGSHSATFARENEIMGDGIEVDYAQDDNVLLMTNRRGDFVQAWLAAGQNIAAGDDLSCVGGGLLGAATPASQADTTPFAATFPTPVVAKAAQTIDNSAGGAVAVRIEVEVM